MNEDTNKKNIIIELRESLSLLTKIADQNVIEKEILDKKFEKLDQNITEVTEVIRFLRTEGSNLNEQINLLNRLEGKLTSVFSSNISELKRINIRTELQEKDKNILEKFSATLYRFGFIPFFTTMVILAFLIVVCYFANSFYKTSVQTKAETKQEIFDEMKEKGQGIYRIAEYERLEENDKIIIKWAAKNPNDSRDKKKFINLKSKK